MEEGRREGGRKEGGKEGEKEEKGRKEKRGEERRAGEGRRGEEEEERESSLSRFHQHLGILGCCCSLPRPECPRVFQPEPICKQAWHGVA